MKRTNGTYAEYDYNTQGFYTDNAYKIQYDLNGGDRLYSAGGKIYVVQSIMNGNRLHM